MRQTFNIGLGTSVTTNEPCQLLLKKLKAGMEPLYMEARSGEIRHSYAIIDKAKRILGYKPKVSLEKGLEDLIKKWMCKLASKTSDSCHHTSL